MHGLWLSREFPPTLGAGYLMSCSSMGLLLQFGVRLLAMCVISDMAIGLLGFRILAWLLVGYESSA